MSRVITFSRQFPKGHPRQGEATYFVEKIWQSLFKLGLRYGTNGYGLLKNELENFSNPNHFIRPKHHTIRAGNRYKVGDRFSPRVWSGKPYATPQLIIAPDIEIKKIWKFEIDACGIISIDGQYFFNYDAEPSLEPDKKETILARNDGLSWEDFCNWLIMPCFRAGKPFSGQIICWNENIVY